MTTLHDRLADLADQVDTVPHGPTDLWTRGRRYGRRRAAATVGTVLAVALIAAVGAAGVASKLTHRVEPIAPEGRTVLPDRFFVPDGQTPVAHAGIGPLVAAIPAERSGWTVGGEPGLVGVSAVDQQYAFLDLPGWIGFSAGRDAWSLSPNGRRLAYWYGDRAGPEVSMAQADGIALLDTTTGELRRHELGGEFGVTPHALAWTGDTLWFTEWEFTEHDEDSASSSLEASYAWDLGQAEPRKVDDPDLLLAQPLGPALEGSFLVGRDGDRVSVVSDEADLTGGPLMRLQGSSGYEPGATALSPDGRTVAVAERDDSGTTARVLVGTVAGDDTHLQQVDADLGSYPVLLGWLDDHSLAVMVPRESGRQLVAVDIETGRSRVLSTFEQAYNDGTQLASDLLRSPVVDAEEPPRPVDPRPVAGAVALGVLVLLWLALVVRRRRARR